MRMNTQIIISIVLSGLLIGGAFLLMSPKSGVDSERAAAGAVSIVDGTQIIDISAKSGYSPRMIVAKEGRATILRVTTRGTFDCSASVVIPKLSYQKFLQPSGTEDIAITAEQAHGTLQGLCAMGMYNFEITFQ